ncbi:hypothetical protein Asp14428_07170 [Actinoplanes sp. NBRC 14428]|nr:hypothetical protein Asp14428_07170 [Actinoplanes sp. NBRC 14428]
MRQTLAQTGLRTPGQRARRPGAQGMAFADETDGTSGRRKTARSGSDSGKREARGPARRGTGDSRKREAHGSSRRGTGDSDRPEASGSGKREAGGSGGS